MNCKDPKHNATLVKMSFEVALGQKKEWKNVLERFFEEERLLQDCLEKSAQLAHQAKNSRDAGLRDALGKARRERSRHRYALETAISSCLEWMRAFRLDLLNRQLQVLQDASRKKEVIQCLLQIAKTACEKDAKIDVWAALVRVCPHHQYFRNKLQEVDPDNPLVKA